MSQQGFPFLLAKKMQPETPSLLWPKENSAPAPGGSGSATLELNNVVDPNPYWIRIQELCGSGSIFRMRIHT